MEHWRVQSKIDGGVMSVGLDDFLTDGQRKDFVLSIAVNALQPSDFRGHRTGELFIRLLEGKLDTTESGSIIFEQFD